MANLNINLVPAEIKSKIAVAKKSANVFSICLVAVFLLAVLGGLSLAANSILLEPNLKLAKEETQKNINALKFFSDLEKKALFINDRAKMAATIEQKRPYWSQVLQNLINNVPQSVQFASLEVNITNSPNFVLEGLTKTERDIINFKDKLEKSDFFKNVAFKSSAVENKPATADQTAEATPAEQRLRFSLEFDLEKGQK